MTATFSFNLDTERDRRIAEREVKETHLPIIIGGQEVAQVPTELPLAALAPLRELDDEITLVLRSVLTLMNKSAEEQERWNATSLVIDVLATNPKMPTTVVDVIKDMAVELLGEDGYARLMATKPSGPDMAFIAKNLLRLYGMSLGESQPPSDSPSAETTSGGETSKPTSSGTTPGSTSEASGDAPESPASSEPAGS